MAAPNIGRQSLFTACLDCSQHQPEHELLSAVLCYVDAHKVIMHGNLRYE